MEKTFNDIKNNIRTINPGFTDDLLDALYEYILARWENHHSFHKQMTALQDSNIQEFLNKNTLSFIFGE